MRRRRSWSVCSLSWRGGRGGDVVPPRPGRHCRWRWCCGVRPSLPSWAARVNPLVSPLQTGLVLWLFAFVVVGVVWLVPSRGRNRVLTTALGHAPLVVAAGLTPIAPAAAPIGGLAVAMSLVAWRCRRLPGGGRGPAVASVSAGRADEVRGVGRTRELLAAGLPAGWRLFEPRLFEPGLFEPRTAEEGGSVAAIDLLLVGPAGCYVIEPKVWQGTVALVAAVDAVGQRDSGVRAERRRTRAGGPARPTGGEGGADGHET